MKQQNVYTYYLLLIAGAILLSLPAFINGYPLVNSDTSTYLSSGFKPETPWDRPITYGILMRIFSLNGLTMWTVVFMQAYIICWLVALLIKHICGDKHRLRFSLLIILSLSIFTSLSWVTSELIADVYTGIAILCVSLILINNESKLNTILLYILFFTSIATHSSNLVSFIITLILLLIISKFLFKTEKLRIRRRAILLLLVLTAATISIMGASIAKSKQMFFVGSLLEKGILKPALDELCVDSAYNLCKYKDALPADVNFFLWDANGPLMLEGGWSNTRAEYAHIINKTMSEPKYSAMFIKASAVFTIRQLSMFNIGDGNSPFPVNSNVYNTLHQYLPHESTAFVNSGQNRADIKSYLLLPNKIIYAVVFISILILAVGIFRYKQILPHNFYILFAVVVIATTINLWSCATFAQLNGRYGCRVMWLIPMLAIMLWGIITGIRGNKGLQPNSQK